MLRAKGRGWTQISCAQQPYCYCSLFRNDPGIVTARKLKPEQTCRRRASNEMSSIFGYIMVSNCPSSWQNASTAEKCLSTNYSADPITALPVVDMTENTTYANIYCAMCHGRSQDLHYWNVRILKTPSYVSLQDIISSEAIWEVLPFVTMDKCIVTPPAAMIPPDTKEKKYCRDYANGIKAYIDEDTMRTEKFKNPHCAVLSLQNSMLNKPILCMVGNPLPPRFGSMLFVLSKQADVRPGFRQTIVRLQFSCPIGDIYDPFQGRCLPAVHFGFYNNSADTTAQKSQKSLKSCRGPGFKPNEFRLLTNKSVLIISHQTTYNNDSYILINQTLILCPNFSRGYTITTTTAKDENFYGQKTSQNHSFTLRIITYVGFSLSIISLIILLVTYFLFAELRTYPGKAVMHLSCAMIVMQSAYFAADPDVVSSAVCAVMGALLHYSILAVFLWMSTIAYNTHKTFSRPSKYFLNSAPLWSQS